MGESIEGKGSGFKVQEEQGHVRYAHVICSLRSRHWSLSVVLGVQRGSNDAPKVQMTIDVREAHK
jgi:hypothetical protein